MRGTTLTWFANMLQKKEAICAARGAARSPETWHTASGQLSRYKHLGKAGSSAYLEAVTQILRRAQTDGLEQAIKTLKAGLQDLVEEGMKNRPEGSNGSRR